MALDTEFKSSVKYKVSSDTVTSDTPGNEKDRKISNLVEQDENKEEIVIKQGWLATSLARKKLKSARTKSPKNDPD